MKHRHSQFRHGALAIIFAMVLMQPLFGQTQWYEHYTTAQEAIGDARWQDAVEALNRAIAIKEAPHLEAETYALRFVDYFPYYWRGVAYFNLGNFPEAKRNFDREANWGTIERSTLRDSWRHYRTLLDRELQQADSLQLMLSEINRMRDSRQTDQSQVTQLQNLSDALIRQDNDAALDILASLPDRPPFSGWRSRLQELQSSGTATPANQRNEQLFEEGLRQYLSGNFAAALNAFAALEQQSPGFRQANDWLRKTQAEMTRLGQKPDTLLRTVIQRDTLSVAPVIAFTSESGETRRPTVRLSGVVRDDQGIAWLAFNLNGKPLTNAAGDPLRIYPPSAAEKRGFRFSLDVPVVMGENQLTVIAQDIDTTPQQSTFPLVIRRKPPLWQEPLVLGALVLAVLLSAGGIFANWYIRRRIAFVNKYNPYIAGAPVRNEKMFFGREALLTRILNALPNNSLMLYGPRRIGKTSLLHQLKNRLEQQPDPDYSYFPVYVDLQGTAEARFFAVMMHDIAEGCEGRLPPELTLRVIEKGEDYSPRDFSADLRTVLNSLQAAQPKPLKLVLLIDEVDELNRYSAQTNQKLRSIFMKTFAENLVAVMAGSHIRKKWESEGSPWYNFFSEIPVGAIERNEAAQLIRRPVKGIFSFEDAAVERILDISGCVPYRIQKICANCIARLIESRRRCVTVADVAQVAEMMADEGRIKDEE